MTTGTLANNILMHALEDSGILTLWDSVSGDSTLNQMTESGSLRLTNFRRHTNYIMLLYSVETATATSPFVYRPIPATVTALNSTKERHGCR